jgi:hypothetical protein
MENSMFTVVGVGVGLAIGLQTKNLKLFILCSTFGTFGDVVYGYSFNCRPLIDDYNNCKAKHDLQILGNNSNNDDKTINNSSIQNDKVIKIDINKAFEDKDKTNK